MSRSLSTLVVFSVFAAIPAAKAYRTTHGLLSDDRCAAHPTVTLSVPQPATPQPDPARGEFSGGFYHVEEIDNGLFYMTDGVYQSIFVISQQGIVLVDAPPSIGFNAQDPGSSVSILDVVHSAPGAAGLPVKKLIYSHAHYDHIGAAGIVRQAFPQVQIIAHKLTKERLAALPAAPGAVAVPVPTSTFSHQRRVGRGDAQLQLHYRGPAHEPGNIFIYAQKQRLLMLVDVIFPRWSPFNDLALAKDIPAYVAAYEQALEFNFETFVGGHLNRLGSRDDVIEGKRYIDDIVANAGRALDPEDSPDAVGFAGVFADAAARGADARNSLGMFHLYLDQVACKCANLTLTAAQTPSGIDWLGRLGAADTNTLTHCWVVVESLRIDHR